MKTLCDIYRSSRREEMYLYVHRGQSLDQLPDGLRQLFGKPQPVATLLLTPEKKLARANADEVLKEIGERGYYLQMPPATDSGMGAEAAAIATQNRKLPR